MIAPSHAAELAALAALPASFPPALRAALKKAIDSPAEGEGPLAALLADEALVARARTYVVGGPLDSRVVHRPRALASRPKASIRPKIARVVGFVLLTFVVGTARWSLEHGREYLRLRRSVAVWESERPDRAVALICAKASAGDCEHAQDALAALRRGACGEATAAWQQMSPKAQKMTLGEVEESLARKAVSDLAAERCGAPLQ